MSFDLTAEPRFDSACEAGYTFEPRTPNGELIGAFITVRGPESAAVRAYVKRQIATLQQREVTAKRRGGEIEPMGVEDMESQSVELAIAYTADWRGFDQDGQPLPFSDDAARRLYVGWSWIRRQVIEQAQDLGNFVRRGRINSLPMPPPNSASI